jgi:thiamine biosynthesis lipoprotein
MGKIIKKIFCLFIILGQLVILTGCLNTLPEENKNKPLQIMYFSYFDTVSNIYTYAGDGAERFQENCDEISKMLEEYHQLFDIYHEYSGINNLCTINKNAGGEALVVDKKLIEFLLYAKEIYNLTNGETNVMLGPVLKLWHDERENASLNPSEAKIPETDLLNEANLYTSIDLLEIDETNNTVRLSNSKARIDVGALGKGYATEKIATMLEAKGVTSYVLNIGGNIRIIGSKPNGDGWVTGIRDPFTQGYALYTNLKDTSCVTSGDYERYFVANGNRYHHIIDGDTLMPATYFSSITVITKDSGLSDALSTALFTMSYEEGLELVNKLGNVEVVWIYTNGDIIYTDGIIPIEKE